jgi:haloalkane dehalogenase
MTTPSTLPPKKFSTVNGYRLAHVEIGSGDPIVLLHGNPTSSYLWRDVMPSLAELGRVIAPDLIGHGDSDKLPASDGPGRYTLEATYDLLAAQLEVLGVNERVTLVLHDWGIQRKYAVSLIWRLSSCPCRLGTIGPRRRAVFFRDFAHPRVRT